jgi:hypothetical protein
MNPLQKPEPKSAIVEAIEERAANRPLEAFDISGYFGPGEKPIGNVLIRYATKSEQDDALDKAHAYTKKLADEDARKDVEIVQDAKLAAIAWYCCRDATNPKYPAFPSPTWMYQNMSAAQIGALVNLCNSVKAKHAGLPATLEPETFDRVVTACSELGASDIPERILAGWERETLVSAFVLASMRLRAVERECAGLREGQPVADTEPPAASSGEAEPTGG